MKLKHAFVASAALVLWHVPAKSADLFVPPTQAEVVEAVTPAPTEYKTGCYVAGSVGLSIADISNGAVSLADDSATLGAGGGCDLVTGSLLLGAHGNAQFNDTSDAAYQFGLRAGVLISPHALLYATGGWALADFQSDFDGWFVGGGLELLINRHLFAGVEYTADLYQAEGVTDITGHNIKGRVGWRF